jgi:hypothetical protein
MVHMLIAIPEFFSCHGFFLSVQLQFQARPYFPTPDAIEFRT